MHHRHIKISGMFLGLALLAAASVVPAQTAKEDLKGRMKNRFAQITEIKKSGKVGENPQGLLEAVKPKYAEDSTLMALMNAENEDRKLLYVLLGRESETAAGEVGMANAKRIFQKAADTDYFKSADGEWKKKKAMVAPE